MNKTSPPRLFHGWIIVLASFCIMVVSGGIFSIFGIFFKPLIGEFGWTRAMTSGAYSLYAILHGFLGIVAGRLSDKFGPRLILTACGLFVGLGFLLMSQISAIWHLYLYFGVVIAIGVSGFWAPIVSTIARWFVKKRGIMTGFAISGSGLGRIILTLLAAWLIFIYDWRKSYIAVGIIALVLVIPAAQFLKHDPRQMGQLPYGEGEIKQERLTAREFSFREAIHTNQFWVLCVVYFCFGFCSSTIVVHIVPHATDMGIPVATAAGIVAIIGGMYIPSAVIIGSIADKIGNRQVLIGAFTLMAFSLSVLLVGKELWMLYLFAAIFGSAQASLATLQPLLPAELFGTHSLGLIAGIIVSGFSIGATIGPIIGGHIFDINGSYQLHFLICITFSIVGIILALLLRSKRNPTKPRTRIKQEGGSGAETF